MDNIKAAVSLYLEMETSYGLMITGKWGTGKTYFLKKTLKPLIESTKIPGKEKQFKLIIVSLFGLKTVDDIQTEIFLQIFPLLNTKGARILGKLGSSAAKGILTLKGLGSFSDMLSKGNVNKQDWIPFHDLVICFDDLERKSGEFKLEEVVGFINGLVENENTKVIVLTNEDKLNKEEFSVLREKTIGISVIFDPEFSNTSLGVIKHLFDSYKEYKKFLESNLQSIEKYFIHGDKNLRTLGFALSYYKSIFHAIDKVVSANSILKNQLDNIRLDTLRFTLAISIEYKLGNINFKDRNELDAATSSIEVMMSFQGVASGKKGKMDYYEKFLDLYYGRNKYRFYPEIYDFVTAGKSFDDQKFSEFLLQNFHVVDNIIPEPYQLFNKLSFDNSLKMSDEDYITLTKKLLEHIEAGGFLLQDYVGFVFALTRFDNPLELDKDKLTDTIIDSMQKYASNQKYVPRLRLHLGLRGDEPDYINIKRIADKAVELNDMNKAKEDAEKEAGIEKHYYDDFNDFILKANDPSDAFYREPIFKGFDPERLYQFFIGTENHELYKVYLLLEDRLHNSMIPFSESDFFKTLIEKIRDFLSDKKSTGPRNYLLTEICNTIDKRLLKST